MEHEEAQARMREIQRIMERTTLYTLLPGAPAVIGGLLALAGCAVSYTIVGSVDFADLLQLPFNTQIAFCAMWAGICAVAIGQDLVLTVRAAKRQGISPTARPGRFAAYSLSPSVFVAGVLTLKILIDAQPEAVRYIVPVWMMCYGTGVYAAGLFSVQMPRILGIVFVLGGAVGLFAFPNSGLVLVALSFGLFHIVFGLLVIHRSRQDGGQ